MRCIVGKDCIGCFVTAQDKPELETLRRAFSQLYVNGTTIDWRASCLSEGNKIDLPHYPWQREEYWEEAQTAASDRLEPLTHPLVGFEMPTAVKGWQNDLGGVKQTYINEHKVDDLVIFPGAGYIEIGLAIHSRLDERNLKEILNVKFGKALVVNTHEGTKIQVFYDKETSSCKIFGWDEASEQWTLHASMELGFDVQSENHKQINLSELKSKIIHEIDGLKHYKIMSSRGLNYGSAFQGVKKAWLGENLCSSLVKVEVPPEIQSDIKDYFLHPAVLDASFQSILQTIENPANRDLYLPVSVDRVLFYNKPESLLYAYATRTETDGRTLKGDIILVNENGEICASFHGMVIQAITDKIAQANNALDDKLFGLKWVEAARLPQAEAGKHVLIGRGVLHSKRSEKF
ncbi:hypothetical protein HED51_22415 [Ochrobactrum grignonense]|nr:hypothetical protein [Brucella grignonensis]